MDCGIDKQIAINADEPEAVECPSCFSSMTEYLTDLLECDECPHAEFKGEIDE